MKEMILKILKIVGIVLASAAGLFVLLTIINIIFPSVNYFGYRFIVKNYDSKEVRVVADFPSSTYNLNISTTKYDIEIASSEEMEGWISYKYLGVHFGVSDAENVRVLQTVNENTLNLTVLEPLGWVTSIKCKLINTLSSEYDYNLSVSTISGNTTVKGVEVRNFNAISKSGNFSFYNDEPTTFQSLNMIK